jgi:hypothetical protein
MSSKRKSGIGLDVGTGILVMSYANQENNIVNKSVRDSFLELTPPNKLVYNTMRKGLVKSEINFFESEDKFFILGDDSLIQSIERQMVVRRPMSKGVISPKETYALPLFKALLREVLGTPLDAFEKIIYSIPAPPIDRSFDIIYHEKVIETVLRDLGFESKSINEGHAIIFSEAAEYDYTALAISCGAGMLNVAITNTADLVLSFSLSKSGDWIDESSALSLGYDPSSKEMQQVTPNLVTYIKEQGVDIRNPDLNDKVKLSITAHYRALISYIIENLVTEISRQNKIPQFIKPLPVIVSGGTSLAIGFMDIFEEELRKNEKRLPFKLGIIKQAEKPLTAVSEGCLLALLSDLA